MIWRLRDTKNANLNTSFKKANLNTSFKKWLDVMFFFNKWVILNQCSKLNLNLWAHPEHFIRKWINSLKDLQECWTFCLLRSSAADKQLILKNDWKWINLLGCGITFLLLFILITFTISFAILPPPLLIDLVYFNYNLWI